MRKVIFCIIVCLTAGFSFAQDKNAYTIFDSKGNVASYSDLVNRSAATDVVFFGELHDNPIAHWLELELAKDLFRAKNGSLIMGAEMFEADNQLILDEYMSGLISMKRFEDEAKLWNNYQTDYKPLVEFARESGVRFVATNIPRRYASAVAGGGFEVLNSFPDEARKFFAPLPVAFDPELPGYKAMMGMDNMHGAGMQASQNLPKSQAIKDATMAQFIMANFKEGSTFIHYNGSYHSDNKEGIVWYINRTNPNLRVVTVATVMQTDVDKLDAANLGIADFIIVVPESMTRTY